MEHSVTSTRPSRATIEQLVRVRHELHEAIERRSTHWRSYGGQPMSGAELERRIEALWRDLRTLRAAALHLPREQILEAARSEARIERQRRGL